MLRQVTPFHSFAGGPALKARSTLSHLRPSMHRDSEEVPTPLMACAVRVQVFEHVCVLPRHAINTNRGDTRGAAGEAGGEGGWAAMGGVEVRVDAEHMRRAVVTPFGGGSGAVSEDDLRCGFIFHAAGLPTVLTPGGRCKGKAACLRAMLRHAGLGALLDEPGGDGRPPDIPPNSQ